MPEYEVHLMPEVMAFLDDPMDESRILVKHISTNWLEGQYIR